MGKNLPLSTDDQDVSKLLSNLHLTKKSHNRSKSNAPSLPPRNHARKAFGRKAELLQTMLLDISPGEQMQIDSSETSARGETDYPMLLQISDLLRTTAVIEAPSGGYMDRLQMRSYIALLKNCGLTAELHYTFLKHWQSISARFLSSPVFNKHTYWSQHILQLSVSNRTLHCAILAVSALQYQRLNFASIDGAHVITTAYRLRADSERRLRFHNNECDHEVTVAVHLCLLLFDYLTGNREEWTSRILATKLAMRVAEYASTSQIGRHFFWTTARHDRLAAYMRDSPSVLDVDDLIWKPITQMDYSDEEDLGMIDRIGSLYARLLWISSFVRKLSPQSPDEAFQTVDDMLLAWRESFPIDLQTYAYEGELHDNSAFLHALTCQGGPRAVMLHCLYAEVMILRLSIDVVAFQKGKIHEHAMTICRLSQSLTAPGKLLHDSVPADLSMIMGSLYVAGLHLFSTDGKAWLARMLRWIGEISGALIADAMADRLELYWREIRTRPKEIILTQDLNIASGQADIQTADSLAHALADFDMDGMTT